MATLTCPLDAMNAEVYIYSADRLTAIGDLSGLQVGYANFSMATKLQSLNWGTGQRTIKIPASRSCMWAGVTCCPA